ncbi:MAG TPA: hypothetical protein VGS22_13840 [Thermoanaerobaculia bacterium]|jgi:hypothetical protein|nr:hypothetical protein [Thermoanaerobaculia bacterium]
MNPFRQPPHVVAFLSLLALVLTGCRTVQPCTDQSPRVLQGWNTVGAPATIARGTTDDTLVYTPAGGTPTTLHRCGQHYHCQIENLQPTCPGQHATAEGGPPGGCPKDSNDLPVGTWIEVHTVFSSEVAEVCDTETLNCCKTGPVVVMGYHAKVTANTTTEPIPVDWGLPAAEWSGSNTSPDESPGECKPISAKWRFSLGCDLTVGHGQLGLFRHADAARGLQPPNRLSSDLNRLPN